jgi:NhaP-type Na+/H+ or K+/H+ antiporter
VDDVVSITLFSVFLGIYQGQQVNFIVEIIGVPLSILLGIIAGLGLGLALVQLFKKFKIGNTEKTLIVLGAAILLKNAGDIVSSHVPVAALVGVMVIGLVILQRMPDTSLQLTKKFNKVWIFAEILLFVLVGAQVNVGLIFHVGFAGLAVIILGLTARSMGVLLSLLGSDLNLKEKIFCVAAYIPKATVQAAVGAIPLAARVAAGETILAMAVLAILFTAPLGSMAVKFTGEKFLSVDEDYQRPRFPHLPSMGRSRLSFLQSLDLPFQVPLHL